MRYNVIMQGLWKVQIEDVINVRLQDPDCYNHEKDPMKTLKDQQGK